MSAAKQSARYPTPEFRRLALAPSIIAAIVLLATVAVIGSDAYLIVRFVVCIFALIVAVFVWQSRAWWWLLLLVPVAVFWNPILPLGFDHDVWLIAHYVASLVFIVVGILVKVRNADDKNAKSAQ